MIRGTKSGIYPQRLLKIMDILKILFPGIGTNNLMNECIIYEEMSLTQNYSSKLLN
ncbi:hypothetical protein ACJIZ3_008987 [Penstemon smallii]|uniref:Uncharacterized protein n=1 Tax=Penstemon smallii TaxID=265156 RepID=A0ABD3TCB8_9LAMI